MHADVSVDWLTFTDLAGGAPKERSTKDLLKALDLVVARPLSGIEEDYWEWAQAMKSRMCLQVSGVTHEVMDRAREQEDHLLATRAVEVGLQAVPEDDRMWDRAITIANAAGGPNAANAMSRRRRRASAWQLGDEAPRAGSGTPLR